MTQQTINTQAMEQMRGAERSEEPSSQSSVGARVLRASLIGLGMVGGLVLLRPVLNKLLKSKATKEELRKGVIEDIGVEVAAGVAAAVAVFALGNKKPENPDPSKVTIGDISPGFDLYRQVLSGNKPRPSDKGEHFVQPVQHEGMVQEKQSLHEVGRI